MDNSRYGSEVNTPPCNFGIRHAAPQSDKTPGPSSYSPEKHEDCVPSFSFTSRQEKQKDDIMTSPGPADYTPQKQADYNPSYSFGFRHERHAGDDTPGPNFYAPETHEDYTDFCNFGRRNVEHSEESPGPATYEPEKHVDYTPSFSFGRHDDHRVNCPQASLLHQSYDQQDEEEHKFY